MLAAHAALELAFRERSVDEAALRDLVRDLAEKRGELQEVHLRAHLETARVLTASQVREYNALRGYGAGHGEGHEGHGAHG